MAGCTKRETAVERGDREQVLHLGNKDEPADLDPQINTAISTGTILQALFQGLLEYSNDGKTLQPGVADHWEVSQDGLKLVFHLREDARWSNGAPLTSRDFRDSFLRLLDPQLGCENAGYAFPITGARDFLLGRSADPETVGIKAPDARTLVILLDHPAAYLLKLLAKDPFFPVYMPSLDAHGGRRQRGGPWTRPGELVGNGPFSLLEWRPNVYVRVGANPYFWDARRVRLREVRFYPTDDEGAEERAFRTGQLHVTYRIPKAKLPAYEAEHAGELHILRSLRTNFLTFNVTRAPFTDSRVRRAFSLAVDREKLVGAALGKLGISPASPTQSSSNQTVTVNGTNFQSGLTVTATFPSGGSTTLSGTQIQNVTAGSFQLLITLNAAGTWGLQVNNPGGQTSNTFSFSVAAGAPTITSISPASPTQSGSNQTITVNGTNFQSGLTVTATFPSGGSTTLSGTQIQNVTAGSFQLLITLNATGTWGIRVNNSGGQTSNTFNFTVL